MVGVKSRRLGDVEGYHNAASIAISLFPANSTRPLPRAPPTDLTSGAAIEVEADRFLPPSVGRQEIAERQAKASWAEHIEKPSEVSICAGSNVANSVGHGVAAKFAGHVDVVAESCLGPFEDIATTCSLKLLGKNEAPLERHHPIGAIPVHPIIKRLRVPSPSMTTFATTHKVQQVIIGKVEVDRSRMRRLSNSNAKPFSGYQQGHCQNQDWEDCPATAKLLAQPSPDPQPPSAHFPMRWVALGSARRGLTAA